jgi:tungstate transport system ATP-binding protein
VTRASPILPIEAERLSYATNGHELVRGVSFRLDAGARTVVMGPNGAGKTLLLRLLHGLLAPTGGSLRFAGAAMSEAIRRRQGMVFQRPVLLRRSVAANVRFFLAQRPELRERSEALLAEALARAGLSALAERPARVLSAGEQQRLALARALALEPEILFLDEPTASLDPASVQAIEELVEAAHARGTKIVFVTHELAQARRLADDVLFLHGGRVVEHGAAVAFFSGPASETARAYLEGRLVP